ncbi:hypothetical protein CNMCM8927_006578 [Aspergillus lentulus]|uniref:Amine oxidase n=1 Tax=Aspergillus lentulus TaxID=293939 RepID=A0AAN5YNT5_ASPLE|nr:hypothetical protein CNMCM6069_001665 [Aspergillus lentulus]KAF4173813.1 hypothetical protein CNMCM8060_009445 [Aspergillus lentulus]KAF4198557.1 hypothetical protein CNMCM8694_009270 [Aspergillus lentulus]KAF4205064.1 hypothetical protein CNMCM8927_006578 [Aspergillus lentulus]
MTSKCCSGKRRSSALSTHSLDPLSADEITTAATLLRQHAHPTTLKFNCITLHEPLKAELNAFLSGTGPRPARRAFSIVLKKGTPEVSEAIVNLTTKKVESWKSVKDVMPTLTLDDLSIVEHIASKDPRVVEACREIGITDMSRVYFDAWAIGIDERWGFERRLQQALPYYRSSKRDNQYAHPLDFTIVADTETQEILSVDVRRVNGERTPVPLDEHNYLPQFIKDQYRPERLKPIEIRQPEGVSFRMNGNEIEWAGLKMHVGFNYREGIVLSNVRIDDPYENRERKLFHRVSVVEMVVPYGCPKPPHHKKHAFDVGEYGSGFMTNSLKLGCDCKGAIQYLDAVLATSTGDATVIENAICIHEEDNGLLYKHTDFRDGNVISARDRKLIISQIITAANYEYAFYHTFTLDGTYKLEVKLTGMLNTYCLHPSEQAAPFGTEIARGLDAQNHQHIFSLRVDPEIDGPNNTVVQSDAVPMADPVGSPANPYGNGFYAKKTSLRTALQGIADYCHETSRGWDITNPSRLNPSTGKPIAYKILNNNCPALLAKPGSTVHKRAGFARHALWVLPYRDHEIFPAGQYVCQSTGEEDHPHNATIVDWAARNESIEDTDIVCYIQFGLTHFPRTEDFPIMPAEPVSVMLRASNFFQKNPALWVPPSDVRSKPHHSQGVDVHLAGAAQLIQLYFQKKTPDASIIATGAWARLFLESFMFHVATSIPFQLTSTQSTTIDSAFSLAENILEVLCRPQISVDATSPVLGVPPKLFHYIYTIARMYQQYPCGVDISYCNELEQDLRRWDTLMTGTATPEVLTGPRLYVLCSRILLNRLMHPGSQTDNFLSELISHAILLVTQLQPAQDYFAEYYSWPFLVLGTCAEKHSDRQILLSQIQGFWQATNNGTMRRLENMLTAYWTNGKSSAQNNLWLI